MTARRTARTLKTPEDLAAAGLIASERRAEAAAIAARYAVALTPAVTRLIDASDPADPVGRQYLPDARELLRDPAEERRPNRRRPEEPAQRAGSPLSRSGADQARRGLRGLLPLLLPPRNDRAGREGLERGRFRRRARLHPRPPGNLGGGADGRRSARPVAAPPRRDDAGVGRNRAPQGAALAHPPAGGRARAGHQGDGARAGRGPRQDGLCRAARQPSARTDRTKRAPLAGG